MNADRIMAQARSAFSVSGALISALPYWIAMLAITCIPQAAVAITGTVTNVIPTSMSNETTQNSEPSIGVNPGSTNQAIISAFTTPIGGPMPYYFTNNGGTIWSNPQSIAHGDTTVEWSPGGTPYMARLFNDPANGNASTIEVQRSIPPNPPLTFFPAFPASQYAPGGGGPDQPWLEVNRVAGVDRFYVGFNDTTLANNTASVRYSTNGGGAWANVVIENTAPAIGNGAAVRVAATGNRVYAAFQRFTAAVGPGDFTGSIVVVRDNDVTNGVTFNNLGAGGNGVAVNAAPIRIPYNNATTGFLGLERLGSDLSIAVDPNDPNLVYVAYAEAANNRPLLHVDFSKNGGQTWNPMLTRDNAGLPALSVTSNGAVGLLYTSLNPANNNLETHFLQTRSNEEVLATFASGAPALGGFNPYIGDYQDLEAVGKNFYGTFSASNNPNPANFPQGVYYQRNVNVGGTVMNNFTLTAAGTLDDGSGGGAAPGAAVNVSIDPYFFSDQAAARSKKGTVSFSVDGGYYNPARLVPNPAEGLENVIHGLGPNDVYVLGPSPAVGPATGGFGLPTEGEIFVSGTSGANKPPDGTNIDRLSGALGNVPRVGPHAIPGPFPATGAGVFGLVPNDNIISTSYGLDSGEVLYFSVDPLALGAPGTDVNFHSVLSPGPLPVGGPTPENPGGGDPGNEAAGDVYASQRFVPFGNQRDLHLVLGRTAPLVAGPMTNKLLYDEVDLGLQAPAFNGTAIPGFREDDLDALELADPGDPVWGNDFNGNGTLDFGERPTWFSLDQFSPSIGAATIVAGGGVPLFTFAPDLSVSPDDILLTLPGGEDANGNGVLDAGEDIDGDTVLDPFVYGIYASGLDIGLVPGDVLDALALSDAGLAGFLDPTLDVALFSLAPGSPSLAAFGLSAADVFITDFTGGFGLYASFIQLGLQFEDNLNALDILPVPEPSAILLTAIAAVIGTFFVRHRRPRTRPSPH